MGRNDMEENRKVYKTKKKHLRDNIQSSKELSDFLIEKGQKHTYYKYYTGKNVVDSIIKGHSLFLSNGSTWNDLVDRNNFNQPDSSERRYAICMSYTKAESIAMWVMYGNKDGFLLDLGKSIISECLKAPEIECGTIRENNFEKRLTLDSSKFKINVMDVVYYGEPKDDDKSSFYIRRGDDVVQNCDAKIIQELPYCKKTLPWYFECECRLIVSVDTRIEGIEKCDVVRVPFKEGQVKKLKKRIYHFPNIKSNLEYEASKLKGFVDLES